jgi:hypothetical protein
MARSDRETQGAEEYQHLRGDAVDSAVEDADDGDREAARNIRNRHGHFLFLRFREADLEQLSGCGHPP